MGCQSIACHTDVTKLDQMELAVEKTLKKFGTIDVLINNAGFIKFQKAIDFSIDDLNKMHSINTRAVAIMSKFCIPYLRKSENGGHIVNISPPINLDPSNFPNKIAYTTTKYMTSMLVLGLSEELRKYNISVNALWPKYAIFTESMLQIAGLKSKLLCRKPEIMADACYSIISHKTDPLFTGNFCVDEDILRTFKGLTTFDEYAYDKNNSSNGKLIKVPYNQ
ncbi:hydroxysteroid dehydrogenase-like protein 2 isoform X3 [Gordionus sp. m RMFG-2023]